MSWRRNLALSLAACGMASGGLVAAQGLAHAKQGGVVVLRFMLGYFDGAGRFVPTAGRGSTNVDRNAIAMFTFSGPIDMGGNTRASLPLTLDEQAILAAQQAADPDFDPALNGYEPGVIPRKKSTDRAAFYVATGSVNARSVSIAAPQIGGTDAAAPGQFFKVVNGSRANVVQGKLLFNPRYVVATFNQPSQIDYNPLGLDAQTTYNVKIDGGTNPTDLFDLLKNVDGAPMATAFSTTFTTTSRYVQDYTRPQVRLTSPTDGTSNVQSDADIELQFSEPMDIASFVPPRFQGDDQWTVIARYSQNPVLNGTLQGTNLLLQVRVKPQTGGNVIQLRPLQGFGVGPYEIEVIVRNGVTDLSGNNIIRQLQFAFKTVANPTADIGGQVLENFSNNNYQDPTFGTPSGNNPTNDDTVANWNGVPQLGQTGFLTGVVGSATFVAASNGPTSVAGAVNLWGSNPLHFQNLYRAADVGGRPRTITGFAWRFGQSSGLTYAQTVVLMGHANDLIMTGGFPGAPSSGPGPQSSYYRDTPIVCVPATIYTQINGNSPPQTTVIPYIPGPKFATNFNSDGFHDVILDISHNGNGTIAPLNVEDRWRCDTKYAIQANTYFNGGTGVIPTGSNTWYFDTQFTYLAPGAEAESLFYDTTRDDNRMLPPFLVPTTQPQGTQVIFTWAGAKADVATPTKPDLSTLTPWVTDLRQLSNYRYIKFHVNLLNNLKTKVAPTLDSVLMPYVHK
jgi:hypothetical protein